MERPSELILQLRQLTELIKGTGQEAYYRHKVESARHVDVVPCSEVFTKEQVSYIKRVLRPKKKECYKNAMLLCEAFDCLYCEGMMFIGIGIDHAFNKVGDKYVDITVEFAIGEDPSETEYIVYGEYDEEEAMKVMAETGFYGGVFDRLYFDKMKESSRLRS